MGGRMRGKVASSAGDVPSLRKLQGFREGPPKAGGSWKVGLKGGVGRNVSFGDTPEKGWPLAHKQLPLPEQRTGRRVGLEEPRLRKSTPPWSGWSGKWGESEKTEPETQRLLLGRGDHQSRGSVSEVDSVQSAGPQRGGGELGGACL